MNKGYLCKRDDRISKIIKLKERVSKPIGIINMGSVSSLSGYYISTGLTTNLLFPVPLWDVGYNNNN